MDSATFRLNFPEFADPESYTDPQIEFWLSVAGSSLNADRWGNLLDYGTSLFVAHHLALAKRDLDADAVGGVPGAVNGPKTSKTVGKVSSSHDTSAVTIQGGGMWNGTRYGVELLRHMHLVGAGGLQA